MAETAMSFNTLNYSGLLFNKGNTRTPLSSIIGSRQKVTDHVVFVTGQEYTGGGTGSQPAISEEASLTAPTASIATREQKENVTQIFMEKVSVSYAKMSNMGTLSGVNIANQQANPMSELDFQASVAMQRIARNIEYTSIQGTYHKATADSDANKTRGLVEAITTNTKNMSGAGLGIWDLILMQEQMYKNNSPVDNLVAWCGGTAILQLNADAASNGLTVVPNDRTINGIALDRIVTPYGDLLIRRGECMPDDTAMLLNLDVISPVGQPVPGKGNFFMEELSRTGAGVSYQIFGQFGLDHGPEWYHAKFTGISTTFTKPEYSRKVWVMNSADAPLNTKEVGAG